MKDDRVNGLEITTELILALTRLSRRVLPDCIVPAAESSFGSSTRGGMRFYFFLSQERPTFLFGKAQRDRAIRLFRKIQGENF